MKGVLIRVFMLIHFGTYFTHVFMESTLDLFGRCGRSISRDHCSFVGDSFSCYHGDSFGLTTPIIRNEVLHMVQVFFWFPS